MCHGVELMKKLITCCIIAWLLAASALAIAQVGPAPGVGLQDEGVTQGRVQILNCTGAGITCSKTGVTGILNASGGAGSANGVVVSINLGTDGGLIYTVTVTGQAWVTATSSIACSPFGTTADGLTPETVMAAGVQVVTSAYVAGTGFNLSVYSPHGATGTYRFGCTGV